MAVLYLHMGTPKTGTSAIQHTLSNNRAILEKQNAVFPDFGLRYDSVSKDRNAHFLIENDDPDGKDYALALDRITELSKTYEKIIISEESFWRQSERLVQFRKDLKEQEIRLKVIVYLRRQDLYLQSQYAQHVKVYLRDKFEEYVASQELLLDYYRHIQLLADQIGKENLIIRVYEKQQFLNNDLIADFLNQVGIRDRDQFTDAKDANRSLDGIYLETKRLLNRNEAFQGKDNFVVRYLKKIAENSGRTGSFSKNQFFTSEKQKEFLRQFEESNQKIAREFLGRDDGVLFRDTVMSEEEMAREVDECRASCVSGYSAEEFVDVLAEVILMEKKYIDTQNEKINSLNAKINSLNAKIDSLNARIDKLNQKNHSLNTLISELKTPSGFVKHAVDFGKKKLLQKVKKTTDK